MENTILIHYKSMVKKIFIHSSKSKKAAPNPSNRASSWKNSVDTLNGNAAETKHRKQWAFETVHGKNVEVRFLKPLLLLLMHNEMTVHLDVVTEKA